MRVEYQGSFTEYFCDDPIHAFGGGYDWAYFDHEMPGFDKMTRVTNVIDLSQPVENIFGAFLQTCRNEIHRAEKLDGIVIDWDSSIELISDTMQKVFTEKELNHPEEIDYIVDDPSKRFCFSLEYSGILITHSYFFDSEHSTVLLRTSASQYRNFDNQDRKLTGYLNRYFHFRDMLYFREKGIHFYDFGGLGFVNEYEDPTSSIQGIIKFKKSFGGDIKTVCQYTPLYDHAHNYYEKGRFGVVINYFLRLKNLPTSEDWRFNELMVIIEIIGKEKAALGYSMLDYLPGELSMSLDTIRITCSGLASALNLNDRLGTEESMKILDDYLSLTHFSDIAIEICRQKKNVFLRV